MKGYLRWAAAVFAVYAACCTLALLTTGHGDVAWFVHFGDKGTELPLARSVLGPDVRVPLKDGQDGETFWVLARDPLLLHPSTAATALDRPAYRAQRMGYPLLAAPWRLAFGERGLLWGMILTNLILVGVGTALAAGLAGEIGAPWWGALAFGLTPAVVVAVVFDMSDVLAAVGLLGALVCLRHERFRAAILLGVIAGLAKEPSLLALGALACLSPGWSWARRVALVGIPAAVAGGWGLFERWRFGWPATQVQEFTVPFKGFVDAYRLGWRPTGNWGAAAAAVAILVLAIGVVVCWWQARQSSLMIAALPYAVLIPFLSAQVLDLQDNSWRALGPAFTLLVLHVGSRARATQPSAA